MAENRGFISTRSQQLPAHVERIDLLSEINQELIRSNMVILCGPWGYGRTELLRDFAHIAHSRVPSRPVVTIDFDAFEIQAFLAGNSGPLSRLLNRRSHRHRNIPEHDDASAGTKDALPVSPANEPAERRHLPTDQAGRVSYIIKEYMATYAPEWYAKYARHQPSTNADPDTVPLVTIDNLPHLDHKVQEEVAETFKTLCTHGVCIVLACSPMSCIPRNVLPNAYVFTSTMLSVPKNDLPFWAQELHCPDGFDIHAITQGIPLLIDALRAVHPGTSPNFDAGYLRASGRVVEHCLNELVKTPLIRACCAMTMLGHGTLNDLSDVGISLQDAELAALARTYPLFGIDPLKGTFSCIPVSCENDSNAMLLAVNIDQSLTERCICLLLQQQRLMRAGEITALLPNAVRVRLLTRYPDEFANVANGGIIARAIRSLSSEDGIEPSLKDELSCWACLHAIAHDKTSRHLPADIQRLRLTKPDNIIHTVYGILDFWRNQTSFKETAEQTQDIVLDGPSPTCGIDEVAVALGSAALKGDVAAYHEQLSHLEALVSETDGSLAQAIYITHAAICGMLCDPIEHVLAWLEPYHRRAVDPDAAPDSIVLVSQALLDAVHALACFLVELPSSVHITGDTLNRLKRSRRFFEECDIKPGIAFVQFLEAVCLLLSGNEHQAANPLEACRARWGFQGIQLGQCVTEIGLALAELSDNSVMQAAVHAKTAVSLAQRIHVPLADELSHLILNVTVILNGDLTEINRQLFDITLRRTALYPHTSPLMDLNAAILSAVAGDKTTAHEILSDPQWLGHPDCFRLLVSILRALGRERRKVVDVLPRRMRTEYEKIRPSLPYRGYMGIKDAPTDYNHGLLSITSADKNLSIHILGGLHVEINGQHVNDGEWRRRLSRIALSVLALFPENPVSRETIIEVLWNSKAQTAKKRNNLNTILSSLRASLGQKENGPYYLISSGDALYLNLALIDSDILQYENMARMVISHANSSDYAELLDMSSQVESLFGTGLGDEFNDLSERITQRVEELTNLFINCMLIGSHVACEHNDYQLAIRFARAAKRCDPDRSEVNVALDEAITAYERQRVKGMLPSTTDPTTSDD